MFWVCIHKVDNRAIRILISKLHFDKQTLF
jgi:hypothetical protein